MIPARCSSGLSHEQNIAKMRLLTFMGMAVEFKEISFDTMQQELQIGADEVEAFVIDGKTQSYTHEPLALRLRGNPVGFLMLSPPHPPISPSPPISPVSSRSYQDGVLQNRPDPEKSSREVRVFIGHLCDG